jgi:hypothetical protein
MNAPEIARLAACRPQHQQGCPERRPSARCQHVDAVLLEVRAALGADGVGDDRIDRLQLDPD